MAKIGIIGGTALFELEFLKEAEPKEVKTEYGCSFVEIKGNNLVFLPRHGRKRNIPAHQINHRANIASLHKLGVDRIIGVNSVGSLKQEIPPGYLLIPDDYISLWNIPTFYNEEPFYITPNLSEYLRQIIISSLKKLEGERGSYKQEGVYIQTTGPRLETRAEIRLLKNFGDVVGMTLASEATLAQELMMDYAAICSVDNYCHGITSSPLTYEQIETNAKKNQQRIEHLLKEVIKELGAHSSM